jgi:hypothetical protein
MQLNPQETIVVDAFRRIRLRGRWEVGGGAVHDAFSRLTRAAISLCGALPGNAMGFRDVREIDTFVG